MKTGEKQIYVSPKKRRICNIADAAIILAAATVAVLSYFDIIPLKFSSIINGVILSALGIVFFVNALIQGNSVSMWLAFCFIVPAVMSFLCKYGITSYGEIYPVYIALPGIACLGAMIISREFWRLTKAALVFFIAAAIFVPHAAGALGMGWTLAMLAGYLVILAAALIVYLNKGEKK